MRPGWRTASRLCASVGLVALVLWWTDAAEAGARLAATAPGWLALAAALLVAQTVLMALRWRLTAARLGIRIAPARAVGEYLLAQAVNATLPGGVLGDAARAVRSRDGAGLTRAAHAVMIERMAGQVAMAAVAATGLAVGLAVPGGIAWPAWTGPAAATALAALALAPPLARRLARGSAAVAAFARSAREALLHPDALPRQAALGLAIAALNLLAFAACARATGTSLGPEAVATLVPLILAAMLVPLSVAGWGWREGAAAALFPLAGASPSAGVAAGLAFGAAVLATSVPGLLWPALAPMTERALPPREPPR